MRRGDFGPDVKRWQVFLASQGLFPGLPGGEFNERTEEQTKAFQGRHNLSRDGVVGPQTLGKAKQLGIEDIIVFFDEVPLI